MISTELRKLVSTLGVLGGVAISNQALASPVEHEVDTSNRTGAIGLRYGDHTVNAGLSTAIEVDRYSFAGQAGDQVRILLHTLTGGLDPSLVLRSPSGGTVLGSAACSGNDYWGYPIVCSTSMDIQLPATGNYTLNTSDLGANESGDYQVHLERYPPVNNWQGLAYATSVTEALGHTTDMDFFAFNGVGNTGVRLTLATTTGGLDPVLEVWDPLGVRISNSVCSGNDYWGYPILCSNSVDLDLSLGGIYKVGISDSGWDEAGGYQVGVFCLYGECPSPFDPPPNPIPEPATYALMLAGLALFTARKSLRHTARA